MIRPATPQDAGAVAAIWNHFIRTSTITFTTVEKTERDITALIADRVCLVVRVPATAIRSSIRCMSAPICRGRG